MAFKNEKEKLAYAMFSDLSNIEKTYRPSEEELRIIMNQTSCSEEDAKIFFNKNKGDLEETIFNYLELNNDIKVNKPKLVSVNELLDQSISTQEKMDTYRDILYHKDLVFQQKFDESSNFTGKKMEILYYVPFDVKTTQFRKLKFKGSKDFFSLEILKPFMERQITDDALFELTQTKPATKRGIELEKKDTELTIDKSEENNKPELKSIEDKPTEEVKEPDVKTEEESEEEIIKGEEKKVVIKTVIKKGLTMARKWGCQKPIIAYMELDEKERTEDNINKLATKFMRACEHFDETQNVYGPAIMIDNWIM